MAEKKNTCKLTIYERHADELVGWTRYGWSLWTLPYILLFFNKGTEISDEMVKDVLNVEYCFAKFLMIYSIAYDKVINDVYRFYIALIREYIGFENKGEYINTKMIKEFKEKCDNWNPILNEENAKKGVKQCVINKIKINFPYWSLCRWVSLFEESDNDMIEELLFGNNKNNYDVEHIYPYVKIPDLNETEEKKQLFYGIGNLMLLESWINRKVKDYLDKKYEEYKNSDFKKPKCIVNRSKSKVEIEWSLSDVEERYEYVTKILEDCFFNQEKELSKH